MPQFSIIIPTYNRSQMVKEAIESALAQDIDDYEIIVVDDGSTDDTKAVVSAFGSGVRYIQQENKGVAAARNTGIAAALGDYMCYLDSDDIWPPEKLRCYRNAIQKNPDISFFFSNFHKYNMNTGEDYKVTNTDIFPFIRGYLCKDSGSENGVLQGKYLLATVLRGYPFYPSTFCVRRDLHLQHLWDPGVLKSEDFNFVLRVSKFWRFYYLDKDLATIRVHDNNKSADFLHKNKVIINTMKMFRDLYTDNQQKRVVNDYISRKMTSSMRQCHKESHQIEAVKLFLLAISYSSTWRRLGRKIFGRGG